MTIIDQRILIPVSQDTIWTYINDIQNNAKWQVDCRSVTFLNSLRSGPGIRWRYSSDSGREYVLETTAWYDGLGYEYTYVDGMPFHESRGRLRLQEIPEGTIVQWTLNYEIRGLVGGLRNAVGLRRQIENTMVTSLKTLWQVMKQARADGENYESKSLMRDALDYEARSQYRSRHVSTPAEAIQPVVIEEPPISDEDTRPRPALTEPAPSAEPVAEPIKPDPIETIPDEPSALDAAEPVNKQEPESPQPIVVAAVSDIPDIDKPEEAVADDSLTEKPADSIAKPQPEPAESMMPTPPAPPIITELEQTEPESLAPQRPAERSAEPPIILETPAVQQASEAEIALPAPEQPPAIEEPAAELESEPEPAVAAESLSEDSYDPNASIWDIFGVPRPSETQEMAAVKADPAQPETPVAEEAPAAEAPEAEAPVEVVEVIASAPAAPLTPSAVASEQVYEVIVPGWRMKQRRRMVSLRQRKIKSAQKDA